MVYIFISVAIGIFFILFSLIYYKIIDKKISKKINKEKNIAEEIKQLEKKILTINPDVKIIIYVPHFNERINTNYDYEIKLELKDNKKDKSIKYIKTYDDKFDRLCTVATSNKTYSIAVLNEKIRKIFDNYSHDDISIKITDKSIKIQGHNEKVITGTDIFEAFFEYNKRINSKENIINYLMDNVLTDENENVRINNMRMLIEQKKFNNDKQFFKKLINNESKDIRFMALTKLQAEYYEEIILELKNSNSILFSKYLDYLLNQKVNTKILKFLYGSLNTSDNVDRILYILDFIIKLDHKKSISHVIKFIKEHQNLIDENIDILYKIIDFAVNNGSKENIPWLIKYLDRNDDIKFKIINVLKNIGDISAVEHLVPFTKGLNPSDIKFAARDAINHLQKNIDVSEKGILTLMEREAGNLSIDESGESGKLTVEE